MGKSFRMCLYTARQMSDIEDAQRLWSLLGDELVSPRTYDCVEDAELPFDAGSAAAAAELYENEGSLFVRGSKDSFVASFVRYGKAPALWNFFLDLKALEGRRGAAWVQWFLRVCNSAPVLYGFGCPVDEFNAKHLVASLRPSGARVKEWRGVSLAEFERYLPGVYWLTVFGPELVRAFGAQRLLSLPGVKADALEFDQVALTLDEPVSPSRMEERLGKERRLAEMIGTKHFFDPERPEANYEPVAELVKTLKSLEIR